VPVDVEKERMRTVITVILTLVVLAVVLLIAANSMSMAANAPGGLETSIVTRMKYKSIGGKNDINPAADTPEVRAEGAEHFQHHCGVCHGLDGQNTGVPFAEKSSPPVADLASARVQRYTDGQLKWIIDNGIRFTGMPGWKGVLDDNEGWAIVRYIRHLPAKGSLGAPKVYSEAEEEHEHAEGEHEHGAADHHQDESKPHTHAQPKK
jgi:mono/diheme cytochrome c family protein